MRSVRFEGPILEIDGAGHQCEWPIETIVDLGLLVAVMFDPDAQRQNWGQFPNIVAYRRDGSEFWVADLPTTETGDRYYSLVLDGEALRANSLKSFRVVLDPLTGKIVDSEFTK